MSKPVKIFVSYSHKDKTFKEELVEFLSPMKRNATIDLWTDDRIDPGELWDDEIKNELKAADIVIFLISPSFLNSGYIERVEIKETFDRLQRKEVAIMPVRVRPSDVRSSKLSAFQALPSNSIPVSKWDDRDSAWLDVTKGLKRMIEKHKAAKTTQQPASNNNTDIKLQVKQLIATGKTKKAIELLLNYSQKNGLDDNSIILQSSRFNGLSREQNIGIISNENYSLSLNKINAALLSIVDDI